MLGYAVLKNFLLLLLREGLCTKDYICGKGKAGMGAGNSSVIMRPKHSRVSRGLYSSIWVFLCPQYKDLAAYTQNVQVWLGGIKHYTSIRDASHPSTPSAVVFSVATLHVSASQITA